MHRHAYNGRKLSLAAGPRRALVRGLVESLILYETITTTEARSKTMIPEFERLVTSAKCGNLAGLRQVQAKVYSETAWRKLTTELAEGFKDRNGGYVRTVKIGPRRGDNAPLVVVSLILPEKTTAVAKSTDDAKASKPAAAKKSATKTTPAKSKPKTAEAHA